MSRLNESQQDLLVTMVRHKPAIECIYVLKDGLYLKPANNPVFRYQSSHNLTLDDVDNLTYIRMLRAAPDGEIIYPTRLGLQIGEFIYTASAQSDKDMLEFAYNTLGQCEHELDTVKARNSKLKEAITKFEALEEAAQSLIDTVVFLGVKRAFSERIYTYQVAKSVHNKFKDAFFALRQEDNQ